MKFPQSWFTMYSVANAFIQVAGIDDRVATFKIHPSPNITAATPIGSDSSSVFLIAPTKTYFVGETYDIDIYVYIEESRGINFIEMEFTYIYAFPTQNNWNVSSEWSLATCKYLFYLIGDI